MRKHKHRVDARTYFGLQVAALLAELEEATEMLQSALAENAQGSAGGPVGTDSAERESGGSV